MCRYEVHAADFFGFADGGNPEILCPTESGRQSATK